jgi:hypothetical protein
MSHRERVRECVGSVARRVERRVRKCGSLANLNEETPQGETSPYTLFLVFRKKAGRVTPREGSQVPEVLAVADVTSEHLRDNRRKIFQSVIVSGCKAITYIGLDKGKLMMLLFAI